MTIEQLLLEIKERLACGYESHDHLSPDYFITITQDLAKLIEIVEVLRDGMNAIAPCPESEWCSFHAGEALAKADAIAKGDE